MKKKFLAIALLAFSAVGLSACGGSGEPTPNPNPNPNPDPTPSTYFIDEPTTIYLWTTAGDTSQTILNKWVEGFKSVEPNVTVVNVKQSGGYDDLENMIITGFTGNNYPDLAYAYPDHVADYIDYNKALKLDEYIDNPDYGWTSEEKSDFIEAYLEEGKQYTVEGTWSLPFSKSTEAMFYNEDILVGLNLSSIDPTINGGAPLNKAYLENLTWEELFEKLAPAILEYNKTNKIIEPCDDGVTRVFGYDSDDNLFITLAHQYDLPYTSVKNGKGSVDFNTQGMKDLLTKFKGYYEAGYLITKGANEDAYVNELFTANQLLFSVGSTGGITYQFSSQNPMNVGVAKIPQAEGGIPSTIMQGPSMCILDHNDDNRALASWLFYKYMTTAENTLEWGLNSTGYYPIRKSNFESEDYLYAADENACQPKTSDLLIARGLNYFPTMESTLYTSPAFKGSSTIRVQVGGLLTQVLLGKKTVDQAFEDAEAASNLAL